MYKWTSLPKGTVSALELLMKAVVTLSFYCSVTDRS